MDLDIRENIMDGDYQTWLILLVRASCEAGIQRIPLVVLHASRQAEEDHMAFVKCVRRF